MHQEQEDIYQLNYQNKIFKQDNSQMQNENNQEENTINQGEQNRHLQQIKNTNTFNQFYDPRTKIQLTNLLFEFFQNSHFGLTAKKIKSQAMLNQNNRENIDIFIDVIKNSSGISQNQKMQKIKNRLEKQFLNCIKKNQLNEALQILNNLMPKYFQSTEKFTDYFLNPPKQQPPLLNEMFLKYFQTERESQDLPTQKVKTIKTQKQIWFVKYGGEYAIAIDLNSKGYMIKDGKVLYEKDQMHDDIITCVRWKNSKQFGTCSADKTVKIWDYKFNLQRTIKDHQYQVNSLCFSQELVISGGHNQFILLHQYKLQQDYKIKQISIKKKQVTQIQYYSSYNQIMVAFCQYKKKKSQKIFAQSSIMLINAQTLNTQKEKNFSEQIYGICKAQKQKTFYINFKSGQIHSYYFQTFQKIRQFYGMLQLKFLIRIESGGPKQKYLVTGSEDGDVLIYFEGKSNPICRLYCQKTVVNCVSWMNKSLICGCDNGQIIIWEIPQQQSNFSKTFRQSSYNNSKQGIVLANTTDSSSNPNDLSLI